jgi:hypothetical protein
MEIEELRKAMYADVDAMIAAYSLSEKPVLTAEQEAAIEQMKAQGYKVDPPKVNQAAIDAYNAADKSFNTHREAIVLKGTRGKGVAQPIADRTFFANELTQNTRTAAFADMQKRLAGIPAEVYSLEDYNPDFIEDGVVKGQMTAKVISLGLVNKEGKLNGKQGTSVELKHTYPGSLADMIKRHRHINGKAEKAYEAANKPISPVQTAS